MDDVHPPANVLASSESSGNPNEPTNSRENRQHYQRNPHRLWRFMWDVAVVLRRRVLFLLRMTFVFHAVFVPRKSFFAPEGHRDKARHVEGRARRGDRAD